MSARSESIGKLAAALIEAQPQFAPLKRTAVNPYFKSKYATLDDVIEATRPALAAAGLVVIQTTDGSSLVSTLAHVSGEWISGTYPLTAVKQDPQAVGAALTYARRYAYSAIVGIAPEDDLDGEDAMARQKGSPARSEAPRPPAQAKPSVAPGEIRSAIVENVAKVSASPKAPYRVTFKSGDYGDTFDADVMKKAQESKATGVPLDYTITLKQNGKYQNRSLELVAASNSAADDGGGYDDMFEEGDR